MHLASYFQVRNPAVTIVIADLHEPSWNLSDTNVTFVECDVRDPIALDGSAVDLVVNLAAVHRTPGHPDLEYHETNEGGAHNITKFCSESEIRTVWFTSSIAVYGPDEREKVETSTPRPVSAYGKSKLEAERIHRTWAEANGANRLVVARPATVFGHGEGGNFTRLAKAMKRRAFFYPGRKDTLKACGYVKDLGPAFSHMEKCSNQAVTFNFAYLKPPTIEEVCLAIAAASGMAAPRLVIPAGVLTGVGGILNRFGIAAVDPRRIEKLMHSTNISGAALDDAGFQWSHDIHSALQDWYDSPPTHRFV